MIKVQGSDWPLVKKGVRIMLSARYFLTKLFDWVLSIVMVMLGLRFTLKLVMANTSTPFVSWVYSVTDALIYPFSGIVNNATLNNGAVVDIVALIALVAYALIGYFGISLVRSLLRPSALRQGDEYVRT